MNNVNESDNPNITKCMIKRSGFVLKMIFSWQSLKLLFVMIPLCLCIMLPFMFINLSILQFIFEFSSIPKQSWMGFIISLVLIILSAIEMFIAIACISCIKPVMNVADKIMRWIAI